MTCELIKYAQIKTKSRLACKEECVLGNDCPIASDDRYFPKTPLSEENDLRLELPTPNNETIIE